MFSNETIHAIRTAAAETGIAPAALLAVADIETGGRAFVSVGGRDEPLIRFEGHYFDRRLSPEKRSAARRAGLSSAEAGGIANPRTQPARWRLLDRAAAIDRTAAYESASWGLGQVMGAHWAWLGYGDVGALVAETRSGALGQARLMARYIEKAGLGAAIRDGDWTAFARGYNGPLHRRNAYHSKIEAAYRRHAGAVSEPSGPAAPAAATVLRPGSRGEAVRELQLSLTALGHPLSADGVYGPATAAAVRRFQHEHGLAADGAAGPATRARIGQALTSPGGRSMLWSRIRGILTGWLFRT